MKKTAIFVILFGILMSGCGKSSNSKSAWTTPPITHISGEPLYDPDGNETTLNGDIKVKNSYTGQMLEFGTVTNGKLNLVLPELPDPGTMKKPSTLYSNSDFDSYPDAKMEPADAMWMILNRNRPILVITDQEIEGFFGTEKKTYRLKLQCDVPDMEIQLVYFTKDATIKAKGTYMKIFEYDIDIKARKGWNIIYYSSQESTDKSVTKASTSGKGITIQFVATK